MRRVPAVVVEELLAVVAEELLAVVAEELLAAVVGVLRQVVRADSIVVILMVWEEEVLISPTCIS